MAPDTKDDEFDFLFERSFLEQIPFNLDKQYPTVFLGLLHASQSNTNTWNKSLFPVLTNNIKLRIHRRV